MNTKALFLIPSLMMLAGSLSAGESANPSNMRKIDRQALVTRHNITITSFDETADQGEWTPIQLGNGRFAFGIDVTGLQTFMLHGSMAQATLSDWGWYTAPKPRKLSR